MEYTTLRNVLLVELENGVSKYESIGWVKVGNVFLDGNALYCQTMCK